MYWSRSDLVAQTINGLLHGHDWVTESCQLPDNEVNAKGKQELIIVLGRHPSVCPFYLDHPQSLCADVYC